MYRILIIEDDLSLAEAMKKQIESWGNEVVCVQDFQNVLRILPSVIHIWCWSILCCRFSTDIIGVQRSEKSHRFRLCLSARLLII